MYLQRVNLPLGLTLTSVLLISVLSIGVSQTEKIKAVARDTDLYL